MRIGGEGHLGRHPDEADLAAALGLDLAPDLDETEDRPGFDTAGPRAVLAHLARCSTCQRRARVLRAAHAGLQALAEHDRDELSARRLERRLMAAWAAEESRVGGADLPPASTSAAEATSPFRPRLGLDAPSPMQVGLASPPSSAAPPRAWRRRVSGWAVAAVVVATATAAAAVVVDRWSSAGAGASAPAPRGAGEVTARASVDAPGEPAPRAAPAARARRAFPGTSGRVRPSAPPSPPADRDARTASGPAPRPARSAEASARSAPARPREAGAERSSSAGETSVSVLSAPSLYVRAMAAAEQAYYERHDLAAALDHARRARRHAADRPQARRADRLACDALIASGRAEEAVVVCARLLDDPNPERVRMTHYALGSLLRGRLGDCARARPHLDAAVVFGHTSLYGADARLQRAQCALEQGDLEQVERDLRVLRQREGLRDHSREVDELSERLSRARVATSTADPLDPAR